MVADLLYTDRFTFFKMIMEPIIRSIADTALWVAVYRAEESERKDAVFHDPYARKLAGDRGFQIVDAMHEGRANSWSFFARTYLLKFIDYGKAKRDY